MTGEQDTVLLLFSRTATGEARNKRALAPVAKQRAQIAQHLIAQSQQIARKSGIDWVQIDEYQQQGHDFATRLDGAIRSLFEQGYGQVITIGNDCPDLSVWHIRQAISQLTQQDVVLGPATDGGFYLMGFRRKAYEQLALRNLPWQQTTLQSALYEALHLHDLSYEVLPSLADTDDYKALKAYCKSQRSALSARLASLLQEQPSYQLTPTSQYSYLLTGNTSLRAPPL